MAKKAKTFYVVGGHAFVQHPLFDGAWLRTDICVLKVPCTVESCGAQVNEPCKGYKGYIASTHWGRRKAARHAAFPAIPGISLVIKP